MKKIIIDSDPGIDDAYSIFLAVNHPDIDLLGITTVYGNVQTSTATANALKLLEISNASHVPVAEGAKHALDKHSHEAADFVHGADGFGNTNQKPHNSNLKKIDLSAAEFIVQQIMDNPQEVIICAIAPLTNLALALKLEPKIADNVKQVVIMGGAFRTCGNVTPAAEANIWNDATAADIVTSANWPVTLVGLDVTMKVILDQNYVNALKNESPQGNFLHEISDFYLDFYTNSRNLPGFAAHDPTALCYIMHPEYFSTQTGGVRVVREGLAQGMTVFADNSQTWENTAWKGLNNTTICTDVKADKVINFFSKYLRSVAPYV